MWKWNERINVQKNDFKRIVGFDLDTVCDIIEDQMAGDYRYPYAKKSNFTPDIVDLTHSTEMLVGDLRKINSYGIVKRNNMEFVVLIDYGITETTFKKHYGGR